MPARKQPELQPFYGDPNDATDSQVLDAVVVKSGGSEKVLVSRWHLGIPKRRILIQAGIILLAVACLAVLRLVTWHGDGGSAATARVQDTKALLAYRHDLARISGELSSRSRLYQQQSASAASNRDLIGLFDAANSYDAALKGFAARLDALALPHLSNARAQEFAAAAQGEFKTALARLESAILQMVEAADRGEIRATALATMQSALRFSDQAMSRQDAMLKKSLTLLGGAAGGTQEASHLP
jgi:hypothetical protein